MRGFCKYVNSKKKTRDKAGPPLRAQAFVKKDTEKAEVLNAVFSSVFTYL